jgi:hypothetical protein
MDGGPSHSPPSSPAEELQRPRVRQRVIRKQTDESAPGSPEQLAEPESEESANEAEPWAPPERIPVTSVALLGLDAGRFNYLDALMVPIHTTNSGWYPWNRIHDPDLQLTRRLLKQLAEEVDFQIGEMNLEEYQLCTGAIGDVVKHGGIFRGSRAWQDYHHQGRNSKRLVKDFLNYICE